MRTVGAVLDDAAARAERKRKEHRVWHWCRRKNGFCDDPLWRMVAERLGLPIHQVVAFANRLEEHANRGAPRGYVGDVKPAVFAAALGMSIEDAARIWAELQHRDILWVDQEHVADFYERNKDDENDKAGAAHRAKRSYARRELRKALARLVAEKLLEAEDADAVSADLDHMGDDELFELEQRRRHGQLAGHLSTTSRDLTREIESSRVRNVRPHPRAEPAEQDHTSDVVDNFARNAAAVPRGDSAGSAKGERGESSDSPQEAEAWLEVQGVRLVVERMQLIPSQAATRIERWKRELGFDAEALALILDAADQSTRNAAGFHVSVTEQITRRLRDAEGPRLPLVRTVQAKRGGAA